MGGADNRLNIVILDSCRDNPFKGVVRGASRGLALDAGADRHLHRLRGRPGRARPRRRGPAQQPLHGSTARGAGPSPDSSLEDVFKRVRTRVLATTNRFQTPWTGSSITGDFFFRLPAPAVPEASAAEPEPAPPERPDDRRVVWNAIQGSQDPTDFQTFLETYPESPLAPFARNRAKTLQPGSRPAASLRQNAQPTPPRLRPSRRLARCQSPFRQRRCLPMSHLASGPSVARHAVGARGEAHVRPRRRQKPSHQRSRPIRRRSRRRSISAASRARRSRSR